MRAKASFGVQLCLERVPIFAYEEAEPRAAKANQIGLRIRNPLSSLISTRRQKRKISTRSREGNKDRVQGLQTKKFDIEVDEEQVTIVSREVQVEINKEMGTKNSK